VASLLISMTAAVMTNALTERMFSQMAIDYSSGRNNIEDVARDLSQYLTIPRMDDNPLDAQAKIQDLIERNRENSLIGDLRILIVDRTGKVLYKSSKVKETEINLQDVLWEAMGQQKGEAYGEAGEAIYAFPTDIGDIHGFVIASGIPKASITYYPTSNPVPVVAFLVVFFAAFYWLTKKKMRYIGELAEGLHLISEGHLQHRVPELSQDELGSLAHSVNHMAQELQTKIEAERQAEKVKNELITNVSHDLRTPLTSVMGYLRLLHEHRYESPEQAEEYVRVAYAKSEQLQGLIEDLFEYTKLSGQNVQIYRNPVCLNSLLEQLVEEWIPLFDEEELAISLQVPVERVNLGVDAEMLVRVLENLYSNAIKYSSKPGEVSVTLEDTGDGARITVENTGEPIASQELERLFERFYRVEMSRSGKSGGSGLGLAIAKHIVALHEGTISAECEENKVRFHVWLPRG
jgi:signal transduction histidine kinase